MKKEIRATILPDSPEQILQSIKSIGTRDKLFRVIRERMEIVKRRG